MSDAEILRASLREPRDFGALFDRHARAIHSYAARRVSEEVAEDVTSETFLIAFEKRQRFDLQYSSALPWLYGIATNLLHAHRRRERILWQTLSQVPIEWVVDPADASGARLDAEAQVHRIGGAIGALSPGDRDTLLLSAWAQLSHEEIAQALRIPTGTVRSRLHRVRNILGAALKEE